MNDKLSGIKDGDRVRVTFEGVVKRELMSTGMSILMDGATESQTFFHSEATAETFHIERIEKPIGVGDRVRGKTSGDSGEIVWMSDTHVVIIDSRFTHPLVKHISNVERLS